MTTLATLKTVSGRLLGFLLGRHEAPLEESAGGNLLVVDDEESICFSMSEYFSQHGFKVDTAREMEEAEGLIKETDYKVIIQDLRLGLARYPDGIEIIKLVHQRNPDTRIVVLTSYGSAEVEEEARRAGADAFLRKPKPLSQVAQVVQGLIESPRTRTVRA
ncbi:MAG TPA: response regulator [Pyrinomonadaceae bacterium]|nr:response regulator [Pyrinomonadaceae bacterium]